MIETMGIQILNQISKLVLPNEGTSKYLLYVDIREGVSLRDGKLNLTKGQIEILCLKVGQMVPLQTN